MNIDDDKWQRLVAQARQATESTADSAEQAPLGFATRVVAQYREQAARNAEPSWLDALQWVGLRAVACASILAVLAVVSAGTTTALSWPEPLDLVESYLLLDGLDV